MIRINPGIGAVGITKGHHSRKGNQIPGIDPTSLALDEVRALLKHSLTLAGVNQHIVRLFMEPELSQRHRIPVALRPVGSADLLPA